MGFVKANETTRQKKGNWGHSTLLGGKGNWGHSTLLGGGKTARQTDVAKSNGCGRSKMA